MSIVIEIASIALTVFGVVVAIIGLRREARRRLMRWMCVSLGAVAIIIASGLVGYQLGTRKPVRALTYASRRVSITTYAGTGEPGNRDAKGRAASFFTPEGIDVDIDGTAYVAEFDNNLIRRVDPEQNVSVYCGSTEAGYKDGPILSARFRAPSDVCVDAKRRRILVAEWGNHCIRSINLNDQTVATLAGLPGEPGITDGKGEQARFVLPAGIDCTSEGVIYVAEFGTNRIRKIDIEGNVSVFAGTTHPGYRDGDRMTHAEFSGPMDLLITEDGALLVADYYNNEIRRIDLQSGDVTTVAGIGQFGMRDGAIEDAQLYAPSDIAFDKQRRRYYIVDSGNNAIRVLNADTIKTLAGGRGPGYRDGDKETSLFSLPMSMCLLPSGDWLVADSGNNRIRRIRIEGD